MPVIRDGQIVEDGWRLLAEDEALPSDGDVIVPLERLLAEPDALTGRTGRNGVLVPNAADLTELDPLLAQLDLVALEFPAFTDGRAYSQARKLRSELGYTGELRASGEVMADQALFLIGVGFDSFEITGKQCLETWEKASRAISLSYQEGYQGPGATRYGEGPPAAESRPAAADTP